MYRNNPNKRLVLLEPVTSLLLDTKTVTFKKPYPLLLWAGGHRFYVTFPYNKPRQINRPGKDKFAKIRQSFSGLPCKGALVFKMAMPENPEYEGKLLGITYPSVKECSLKDKSKCRIIPYIHETKKGHEPKVFKTKCDMTWLITDGSMSVKKYGKISWLVD